MLNLKLQILKLKKEFAKRNDLTSQYWWAINNKKSDVTIESNTNMKMKDMNIQKYKRHISKIDNHKLIR